MRAREVSSPRISITPSGAGLPPEAQPASHATEIHRNIASQGKRRSSAGPRQCALARMLAAGASTERATAAGTPAERSDAAATRHNCIHNNDPALRLGPTGRPPEVPASHRLAGAPAGRRVPAVDRLRADRDPAHLLRQSHQPHGHRGAVGRAAVGAARQHAPGGGEGLLGPAGHPRRDRAGRTERGDGRPRPRRPGRRPAADAARGAGARLLADHLSRRERAPRSRFPTRSSRACTTSPPSSRTSN